MTTVTFDAAPRAGRYGLRQACRAETVKLFSLRSTWWTLLATVAGSLVVTALSMHGAAHQPPRWYRGFDPTNESLAGLAIGSLVIGVLGALAFTSEYGSGTIRSSMAATPRRSELALAKLLVVGLLSLVVGEIVTFACFGLGHIVLAGSPAPAWGLGQPGVARAVALSGVCLGLLGLMGAGIGAALRRTAGAIGAYAALVFVLPLILTKVPGNVARFTPLLILANSVATVFPSGNQHVSPGVGFAMIAAYGVALVALGTAAVIRRDP